GVCPRGRRPLFLRTAPTGCRRGASPAPGGRERAPRLARPEATDGRGPLLRSGPRRRAGPGDPGFRPGRVTAGGLPGVAARRGVAAPPAAAPPRAGGDPGPLGLRLRRRLPAARQPGRLPRRRPAGLAVVNLRGFGPPSPPRSRRHGPRAGLGPG